MFTATLLHDFMHPYFLQLLRWVRHFILVMGVIFTLVVIFSFTTGPFWMYYDMGCTADHFTFKPTYIVIMGGTGYPSESALTRSYFAAKTALQYPDAKVIITQPAAAGVTLEKSDARGIGRDLMIRGVDSSRILYEIRGKNTREEALEVLKIAPASQHEPTVLVTAPEHVPRSIMTFRRAGYTQLGSVATFNVCGPVDLDYKDNDLGGRQIPIANVGSSIQLRYQFWTHLRYQVICYRELLAIAWYKIRGWA
jgi:uncharacterized SAM-binding protein YcdF (DUF218 family)